MPSRIVELVELDRYDGVVEFTWVHVNLDYVVKAYRTRSFGYDCVVVKMASVPDIICTAESYRNAVGAVPATGPQK